MIIEPRSRAVHFHSMRRQKIVTQYTSFCRWTKWISFSQIQKQITTSRLSHDFRDFFLMTDRILCQAMNRCMLKMLGIVSIFKYWQSLSYILYLSSLKAETQFQFTILTLNFTNYNFENTLHFKLSPTQFNFSDNSQHNLSHFRKCK